ncbi:MAG: Fic family protein [Thermoplasmata archaeon]|jgi:Fic family protein|nr:Fic family protein [Thermoplasmata archaeon]
MDLQKRRRGRFTYYYLVHSYRQGATVRKIERYLGRKPPAALAKLTEELGDELAVRQWGSELERIRAEYGSDLAEMPLAIRRKELDTFAIEFTYDSNRIEGSRLTLRETASLLEHGITPANRPLSDVQEALAHRKVFLAALASNERLDRANFLAWHKELFRETKPDLAGLVRRHPVRIAGSKFLPPPPLELDRLLDEFFTWLRAAWKSLHPVVLAALVHLKLVTIHPFGDGNGRTTRIAMNVALFRKGFPMLDIPYSGRQGYYRALERAQASEEEFVFVRWFLRRYLQANVRPVRTLAERRPSDRPAAREA